MGVVAGVAGELRYGLQSETGTHVGRGGLSTRLVLWALGNAGRRLAGGIWGSGPEPGDRYRSVPHYRCILGLSANRPAPGPPDLDAREPDRQLDTALELIDRLLGGIVLQLTDT